MEPKLSQHQKKTLGKRLMDARVAAGHPNRVEACQRFDFNVNTFKAHEYGHRSFNRAEAARYASAFGVTVEHLTSTSGITSSSTPAKTQRTNPHHSVPTPAVGTHQPAPTGTIESPDAAGGAHQQPCERTTRTNYGAHHEEVPIAGASAFGIWLSATGTPLHREAPIPPAPGHPIELQYARQAVGDSRSGLYRDGDYIIFRRHVGGRIAAGHHDILRRKGALSESSVWVFAGGRRMTSDSAALADAPEELEIDPDDTSVSVAGVAIAVFRPIRSNT
jgi:hypothetical protein